MAKQRALLAVFAYLDDLLDALKTADEQNAKIDTVYSPVPRHEIQEVLRVKRSPVRYFTLAGAILGITGGLSLAVYTWLQWKFIVTGKPIVPFVPSVVIAFEFCILFGVLSTVLGMLINTRMPKIHLPAHYDDRFAQDHFGVLLKCSDDDTENLSKMLKDAGAKEVRNVEG